MKKVTLSALAFVISLLSIQAQAQTPSLKNSNWKLFIPDLNDSITMHIKSDSSFITISSGDTVLHSLIKVSADTVSITDYDGQYACPNATGRYKVSFNDDASAMTLTLIDDPCDGRVGAINKLKWTRAAAPAATPMK